MIVSFLSRNDARVEVGPLKPPAETISQESDNEPNRDLYVR